MASEAAARLVDLVHGVEARLRGLRTRARVVLVVTALAGIAAVLVAAIMLASAIDYVVRTPDWFRLGLLVVGLGVLGLMVWRRVAPAWGFKPDLREVALRVERSKAGREAGLEGVLTSGLELAHEANRASGMTRELASRVAERAGRQFRGFNIGALLDLRRARQSGIALIACLVGMVACGILIGPAMTRTALARVLTPWSGAQWPKRTEIVDSTAVTVHPLGQALPLRAALVRSDRDAASTRVMAITRIIDGDGAARRMQLTAQGRTVSVTGQDGVERDAELFERLIEPEVDRAAGGIEIEYWFETSDDRTEPRRVRLVQPPAVVGASLAVTPPEYARGQVGTFVSGQRDMGPGNDARAVVGPILGGSKLELSLELNKQIPVPKEGDLAAFVAKLAPGLEAPEQVALRADGTRITLGWDAGASSRVAIKPVDEFGLSSREEAVYALDVSADRASTATIVEPREDESVLPSAVVSMTAEGRDDVGLESVWVTWQRSTPVAGSAGGAPEPVGEPTTAARRAIDAGEEALAPGLTSASVSATLEISSLGVKPGDEIVLYGWAQDLYAMNGQRHEPGKSSPRRLRIIKDEELVQQIRQELGNLRRAAIRMDADQEQLRQNVEQGAVNAEDRRRQAGMTQRLTQQRDVVERLGSRAERNRLDDPALKDMLAEIQSLLESASPASERASAGMDQAAREQAEPGQQEAERAELSPEAKREVAQNQDEVRDRVARVAEMLDRGEDSWLVARGLQRLLDQQRQLQSQTKRAGEQTTGKRAADLTPQERAQLSQIAEQQARLSDQARAAMDQLAKRAEEMKKLDAAQAQGMRQAEQKGREQRVAEKMNEAARNLQQNQTSTAEEAQQEAAEAVEQMLQELNNAQKNRDLALRRILADVTQALQRLIADQEAQLAALVPAREAGAFAGLDAPMVELNRQTLGVAEQARGDRALASLAKIVDRAAEEQGAAIAALRKADGEAAQKAEEESLRLLRRALDEARKLSEQSRQRDEDRKRAELRQLYRDLLETQVTLTGETTPLIGKTLDRRDRVAVRGLGERQSEIQKRLAEMREKTKEIEDSQVFQLAHDRLDAAAGVASKKLTNAIADASVKRNQESVQRILAGLVRALDDKAQDEDEFREEEDGGGGGGQGGQQQPRPLIPPLAELRLLREMQIEVAERTRVAEDGKDADEVRRLGDDQRKLAERGQKLIEQLKERQQGGPGGGASPRPGPGPQPGDQSGDQRAPEGNPPQPPEGEQP